jgi:hypothetical protein
MYEFQFSPSLPEKLVNSDEWIKWLEKDKQSRVDSTYP